MNTAYYKIWTTVQLIPEGKVCSYGQVADLAGLPGRARLVGKSLQFIPKDGVNDQPVPWFRVVRSSGEIAFKPGTPEFINQRSLLMGDGITVKGRRVNLRDHQWVVNLTDILFTISG